jgi:signal transduction histidine kinase
MLPTNVTEAKDILRKTQNQTINILEEINRLVYELRPAVLDDLGLVSAIQWLAETNLEKAGVLVNFKTTGRVMRLDNQSETILFRVIQEIVHNITRHANAKTADIMLHFKKRVIVVRVTDDGRGFDVEEAMNTKERPRGLGLLGMKERVELVKGSLNIRSYPGGVGTEIDIEIPLRSRKKAQPKIEGA